MRSNLLTTLLALAIAALPAAAAASTSIIIVNGNAPGVGFNDPTPAAPIGGNAGTTVGQQRLIAFQYAADIWGATLDSAVPVRVLATFDALSCTATTAVLGSAGTQYIASMPTDFQPAGFSPALFRDTWYHIAIANKYARVDLVEGDSQIRARFNSNLGQAGCLTGTGWYYGLDTGHGTQINLVTVLLHEFAHGLGFSSFASVIDGSLLGGQIDIYSKYYYDLTQGKFREQMTNAERVTSAINSRNVIWTGPHVTAAVPAVLQPGTPILRITSPPAIDGYYAVGTASFGPQLTATGVMGTMVAALDPADAAGPSPLDACSPLTNAADVAGKIALVNRGTCGFVVKAKNVQNAGAIAMIVADNAAGSPPAGLGGTDPTITIPSVRITQTDGALIRAQLAAGVTARLALDLAVIAGASPGGNALLNAPNPVQSGSSISHWDPIATPNQLMEPAINSDLTFAVTAPKDLTYAQLRDVGWFPDPDLDTVPDDGTDKCPGSNLAATVVIGGENTGVPNSLFPNGCTISDLVGRCAAGARNHGGFVSCVAGLGNELVGMGVITGAQKGAIQRAAAHAK